MHSVAGPHAVFHSVVRLVGLAVVPRHVLASMVMVVVVRFIIISRCVDFDLSVLLCVVVVVVVVSLVIIAFAVHAFKYWLPLDMTRRLDNS